LHGPGTGITEIRPEFELVWLFRVAGIAVLAVIGQSLSHVVPGVGQLQELNRAGPSVNVAAMRDEGELAFVTQGNLYLDDDASTTAHEISVAGSRMAVAPTFSPDGKWVAYETQWDQVPGGDLEL
jgi:Tol biopolymer transport system component